MKKTLTIIGIVLLTAAVAAPVMAWGRGWGRGMMGYRQGTPATQTQTGWGYTKLTEEQRKQLDSLHQKFYEETLPIRNEIVAKSAELNTVLNSQNPDAEKAKALQKEISDLRGKLAEKRTELVLEARKIAPEAGFGPATPRAYGPHMRGYGHAMGWGPHMRGFSPGAGYGPGACWN
ncbi:MAG: Spy/CpxP family protein refolding chaperone [Deltaproteobacteria bacterium]|nr:Spy/CpxP family protein refolding chaperone [Deltaproteobacteria bacterium]MBW1919914.1 Spy/CpxP family protein refolding chaperone [Deltaproteobacteria bacterium]MBW1934729.1 Spy/CpxP family protein refolding chaperone [Deltaproteobacteria bacterium]MBW1978143.1 Spy/CpxP family protein refolding chaperone [Deltaproteobacteria bacterium]MBW2045920.1 Spy/CpxP family protein refolding chaperone [Deltaproteobacteria bacterium]